LGATITAEGVEDEATRRWLANAGCDMVQGFGIARPMPPADFITLLQQTP
ncbi:MAG: EAL domain-containing protein, partial [Gammaproteobacteria bacterium]|nr:EAL domain-containing protein [Gammaproteobacteria bacterium]